MLKPVPAWVWQVIADGQPCHLYFDLEFNTACNPGLQGDDMVDGLLAVTAEGLRCMLACFQLWYQGSGNKGVG